MYGGLISYPDISGTQKLLQSIELHYHKLGLRSEFSPISLDR